MVKQTQKKKYKVDRYNVGNMTMKYFNFYIGLKKVNKKLVNDAIRNDVRVIAIEKKTLDEL